MEAGHEVLPLRNKRDAPNL